MPEIERFRPVSPQKNWVQRYLIQQEQMRREPPAEGASGSPPGDPLELVKKHYYEQYTQEVGQPSVPPESSPTFSAISNLVENAASQAEQTYTSIQEIAARVDSSLQADVRQAANYMMTEVGRGNERIVTASIRWMAEEDPLMSSKWGRLIRRVVPSPRRKELQQTVAEVKREIDAVRQRFLDQTRNKY